MEELEAAASERRGCEQHLLQHARSSSKQQRSSDLQVDALAWQLQAAQSQVAQLMRQYQVRQRGGAWGGLGSWSGGLDCRLGCIMRPEEVRL